MSSLLDDFETRRPRAAAASASRDCADDARTCRLARADGAPSSPVEWAEELAALLQSEILHAARHGVISVSECEQLSARLIVVIDQALSTG